MGSKLLVCQSSSVRYWITEDQAKIVDNFVCGIHGLLNSLWCSTLSKFYSSHKSGQDCGKSHRFQHAFGHPSHTHKNLTGLFMLSITLCLYENSHRFWHAFGLLFHTHKSSDWSVHIVYVCRKIHTDSGMLLDFCSTHTKALTGLFILSMSAGKFPQILACFLTSVPHTQKLWLFCSYCLCL